MGEFLYHAPCSSCGSSDAVSVYDDDGPNFCHSCKTSHSPDGDFPRAQHTANPNVIRGEARAIEVRKLRQETCQKYAYEVVTVNRGMVNEVAHSALYHDADGKPCAQKLRYNGKRFEFRGDTKAATLFGQRLWKAGGRRLVITEGEVDALSVAQMFGLKWPVVSVPNGASGAARAIRRQLEWVDSFEDVVLCFDQDGDGEKAAKEVAELLTPGKARIARLPRKDANDMLVAGDREALAQAIFQAQAFRPDGIVDGKDLWDDIVKPVEEGFAYPWPALNALTHGSRRRELVTWTGGTGIGKSSLVREVAHNYLSQGETVGIIALEESVRHAARAQLGLAVSRPLHLPGELQRVDEGELREAFDDTVGSGRCLLYDHWGSLTAESLLPKIRYLAKGLGVEWIILDHLSIVVSGFAADGGERERIDQLVTELRTGVEAMDIGLHLVSHLRKASGTPYEEGGRVTLNDLRGSGAIAQFSDIIVAAERNQQDEDHPHRLTLRALKNRYSGETGIADQLDYVAETGRLVVAGGHVDVSQVREVLQGEDEF